MSYNIQVGIQTRYYHQYFTRGWRHVLPDTKRLPNLRRIADLIGEFDLVGLQELDAGSLRSGFVDQNAFLADTAAFPYRYQQTNRALGRFAQHSNGLLSRWQAHEVVEHRLPGRIPGRGALIVRLGRPGAELVVVLLHLALSQRARLSQLAYIAEQIIDSEHVIVMGDLNCHSRSSELETLCAQTGLREPLHDLPTYPSWRPARNIDHILVSPSLTVESAEVLDAPLSDHLPMTMDVRLPAALTQTTPRRAALAALSR
ncbi:MAG: endonuclease/exonuclease/phosphatase family protein [Spiribacter sp.]|nr:endonuclease/exonuclease/phosphatase family protein [Spiribacter sp.]